MIGGAELRNRLHAGVMLVDCLLAAQAEAVAAIDRGLADSLGEWVTSALADLPPSATAGLLSCGPVRRDPDGRWWWGPLFLGKDGDPQASLEPEAEPGVVAIALADALEAIAERRMRMSDAAEIRVARRVLTRYRHWQRTGVW